VQLIRGDMDDVETRACRPPRRLGGQGGSRRAGADCEGNLRSLPVWPEGLALLVRRETDRRLSYVGVERRP
jgi:hypothetical protein